MLHEDTFHTKAFNDYRRSIEEKHHEIYNNTHIDENEKEELRKVFGVLPPIFDKETGLPLLDRELPQYLDTDLPLIADATPMEERRKHAKEDPKYTFIFNQSSQQTSTNQKSDHFYVVQHVNTIFKHVGGYNIVKEELSQCVDILQNFEKYSAFNVRIPKGLILEGPPGNGKTLLAKAFAGEANTSFISVAGSEFQEKYVGVGATRVKELFQLAKDNLPCIIFIDEIDAIGRKRSGDGESSNTERDSTLNQLLVQMDGFENSDGIFIVGATNRADLLDPALIRPGRIDKRIFIGLPDNFTRSEILKIHLRGKPHDTSIILEDLVDLTIGMSAAQIENLLNEAMLYALRNIRFVFTIDDVELVLNRVMAGWQPTEHQFTEDMVERISIHEMGHAIIGLLMKQHSRMTKIVINLSSPKTPGYTVFEGSTTNLYTRESLFEHLMVLLGGRIAEEVFYNVSVTTGAINDFEEALKLAEKMVVYYGMGENLIYPSHSEKFKTEIDEQVQILIKDAYKMAFVILANCKDIIGECANILKKKKLLKREELFELILKKSPEILDLY
jgi:cell division protease FtsH